VASPLSAAHCCLPGTRPCRPSVDDFTRLNSFTRVTAGRSLLLRLTAGVTAASPRMDSRWVANPCRGRNCTCWEHRASPAMFRLHLPSASFAPGAPCARHIPRTARTRPARRPSLASLQRFATIRHGGTLLRVLARRRQQSVVLRIVGVRLLYGLSAPGRRDLSSPAADRCFHHDRRFHPVWRCPGAAWPTPLWKVRARILRSV